MDLVIDNSAKVVLNKTAFMTSPPCERALGGNSNVVRAATVGLANSDLFGLITAHLVLKRFTEKTHSSEVNQAYKDGVSDFVLFLAECASELEAQKLSKQQKEPNK